MAKNILYRQLDIEDTHFRAITEGNKRYLEGYASVFNSRSKPIYENGRLFYEVIDPHAFDELLQDKKLDVYLTFNHERGRVMARTVSGTLALSTDGKGLKFRAEVPNVTYANDVYELVSRGDLYENSFAFIVNKGDDTWSTDREGNEIRYIKKVSKLIDVSIVTAGSYADTTVLARNNKDAKTITVTLPYDFIERGGPGSGNFGHAGRPGKVGGSAKQGSAKGTYTSESGKKYKTGFTEDDTDPIASMGIGSRDPDEVAKEVEEKLQENWNKTLMDVATDPDEGPNILEQFENIYYQDSERNGSIDWPEDLPDFIETDMDSFGETLNDVGAELQMEEFDKIISATLGGEKDSEYYVDWLLEDWGDEKPTGDDLLNELMSSQLGWNDSNAKNYVISEAWYIFESENEDKLNFLIDVEDYKYTLENDPEDEDIEEYNEAVKKALGRSESSHNATTRESKVEAPKMTPEQKKKYIERLKKLRKKKKSKVETPENPENIEMEEPKDVPPDVPEEEVETSAEPQEGEEKDAFISRCIKFVMDKGETDDTKQAAAICYSKWDERSESNELERMQMHIKLLKLKY